VCGQQQRQLNRISLQRTLAEDFAPGVRDRANVHYTESKKLCARDRLGVWFHSTHPAMQSAKKTTAL
jgi:hypothetical protein